MRYQALLLDLDGTLLDTAPDMADALNEMRQSLGYPSLPYGAIRPYVSHGSAGMLKAGFGKNDQDPDFGALRQHFLDCYEKRLTAKTQLFPGMIEVLAHCQKHTLPWGIVTNKPAYLTHPLLSTFRFPSNPVSIVCGDTLAQRKPDPQPLLHACKEIGVKPSDCVYVGDSERDICAGNRAGMSTITALYGYIPIEEDPTLWNAQGSVNHPKEVIDWINGQTSLK